MTKIKIFKEKSEIVGFAATGHTGFAEYGSDIICAAISVLTQTAAIGLKEVAMLPVDIEIADGYLQCMLPDQMDQTEQEQSQLILKVMYKGLEAILQEYGDHYLDIEEVDLCE